MVGCVVDDITGGRGEVTGCTMPACICDVEITGGRWLRGEGSPCTMLGCTWAVELTAGRWLCGTPCPAAGCSLLGCIDADERWFWGGPCTVCPCCSEAAGVAADATRPACCLCRFSADTWALGDVLGLEPTGTCDGLGSIEVQTKSL